MNAGISYILESESICRTWQLIRLEKIMTAAANQQQVETIQGVVERHLPL